MPVKNQLLRQNCTDRRLGCSLGMFKNFCNGVINDIVLMFDIIQKSLHGVRNQILSNDINGIGLRWCWWWWWWWWW